MCSPAEPLPIGPGQTKKKVTKVDADRVEQHPSRPGADTVALAPSRWSVLASSAWHWDLQAALAVGVAVGVALDVTSITPQWWWALPLLLASLWHVVLAASETSGLSARLDDTRYGALIRVTDPTEIKFRAPYMITLWVSRGSLACCALAAALFAITDNKTLDIVVSAGTALLVTWAALCLVSLARLFALHESLAAKADSMPEVMDHYIAQHGRSEN